jgi:hypothetical protein
MRKQPPITVVLVCAAATGCQPPPVKPVAPRPAPTFSVDRIGYVTDDQLRRASRGLLTARDLLPEQRQRLPATPDGTRVQLIRKKNGRYAVILVPPDDDALSQEVLR